MVLTLQIAVGIILGGVGLLLIVAWAKADAVKQRHGNGKASE